MRYACLFCVRVLLCFSTLALSYFLYSSMNSTMYPFPYGYALIAGAQSLPRLEPRSAGVHVPHAHLDRQWIGSTAALWLAPINKC